MKRNISQYLRDIIRGSGNRMVDIDVSIRRRVQPSQRPLEVVDPGKERIPAAQSPRQRTLTRNMFNLPWACLCQSRSASTRLVVPQYRTAADASARTRSAPTSRAAPILGSVVGGVLSDRVARRILGGHAGFMVLVIATSGPLMLAYRFVPAGSALFYVGMCASFSCRWPPTGRHWR